MSDESDNFEFSDGEIDERNHEKLVGDILNLNKVQNVKKPSRTEPSLYISEFNLVKSVTGDKGSVEVKELIKGLKSRKKHEKISQRVHLTNKSQTLPTPLEKPQADRIKRSVNYEKSRLQFDRWEGLVTSNRSAPQLIFPLDSVEKLKIEEKKSETFPSTWRLKSELQLELEKLQPKVEEFHVNTDKEEFPLTLKELKDRRKELAKLRAHQSYKEAKARQQNKIKSKKYHRILRREKIKQKLKEFEELQKTNPDEALRKLEDIEKARAEERFSLRHKSTGQWAKSKQIRAKYDKESRQVLAQQLAISRELTQKLKSVDTDSEDEGIALEENSKSNKADDSNPWVAGVKPTKEVVDFVSGYRKYWNEKNKKQGSDNADKLPSANEKGALEDVEGNSEENKMEEITEKLNPGNTELKKLKTDTNKGDSKTRKKKTKTSKKEESINLNSDKKNLKHSEVSKNEKKIKIRKKKVTKTKLSDSVSTSQWAITSTDKDVEDIFEDLEEKLAKKLKNKYDKIKNVKSRKSSRNKGKLVSKKEKAKVDLTIPSKRSKRPILDEELNEQPKNRNPDSEIVNETTNTNLTYLNNVLNTVEENKDASNIDPNKFAQVTKTNLNTAIPDILMTDENEESNQREVILEAFEDDDIADDFEKEKAKEIEKDTPKDIDLNLPGWGSWAGVNIDSSKRKRKRFIIKMPPKMPRKDDNKGSLIINEKAGSKIKPHRVSEVPFPFKTVKDFEASIRAPISNTFVPETAFRRLIEPAVITKMGAIIEPITKGVLIGKKKM